MGSLLKWTLDSFVRRVPSGQERREGGGWALELDEHVQNPVKPCVMYAFLTTLSTYVPSCCADLTNPFRYSTSLGLPQSGCSLKSIQ